MNGDALHEDERRPSQPHFVYIFGLIWSLSGKTVRNIGFRINSCMHCRLFIVVYAEPLFYESLAPGGRTKLSPLATVAERDRPARGEWREENRGPSHALAILTGAVAPSFGADGLIGEQQRERFMTNNMTQVLKEKGKTVEMLRK